MKNLVITLFGFAAILSAQGTAVLSGVLTTTSGSPVNGALVLAYLQASGTGGKFPPVFYGSSGSDGSFSLNGLTAGTYVLCAEKMAVALLNPCLWTQNPTKVTVPAGGLTGVSLTADIGVPLSIRLSDTNGVLSSNPKLDDVLVGVIPFVNGPTVPALTVAKDNSGRTMSVLVPQGKVASLRVYSASLSLADNQGDSFSTPNVTIAVNIPTASANAPSSTTSNSGTPSAGTNSGTIGASGPTLTLTVQGQATTQQ